MDHNLYANHMSDFYTYMSTLYFEFFSFLFSIFDIRREIYSSQNSRIIRAFIWVSRAIYLSYIVSISRILL